MGHACGQGPECGELSGLYQVGLRLPELLQLVAQLLIKARVLQARRDLAGHREQVLALFLGIWGMPVARSQSQYPRQTAIEIHGDQQLDPCH